MVVDFETTGLDVLDPEFRAAGIAIACAKCPGGMYATLPGGLANSQFMTQLCRFKLIAHNVGYDARVMERELRREMHYKPNSKWPWYLDTLTLYKCMSSEGHPGQSWSLKNAQKDVLGWTETNEVDLDNWLIENGHTKTKGRPDKSKMSLAPEYILGRYGALDAQSTWMLYKHLTKSAEPFPDVMDIMTEEMMVLAMFEVEEYFHGLYVDKPKLMERLEGIDNTIASLKDRFLHGSDATPYVQAYNASITQSVIDSEPPQFTKTGKVASRYTKWLIKVEESKCAQHFNVNSKDQLAWIFYDCMFESTPVEEYQDWRGNTLYRFTLVVDGNVVEIPGTPGGKRKIDKKILPMLGEAGKILGRINELTKLRGYVDGMLNSLEGQVHHTNLRLYGTLTGRCSGSGGVNIQQLPKARDYLDCLIPRPGHVFIQMDVDALEPVVLAELSEDSAMMTLYGPDAKPNDIYLFVGASIAALKEEVCRYGYDPFNPTAEAIAVTKKKAKKIRSICKVLHLSAGYGAGPFKIHETLVQSGIDITLDEVKVIHKEYWKLFKGVTNYQNKLKREYKNNGGWFLNGRGIPMPVAENFEKDILNRCIQSTGHFNLLTYFKHLNVLRKAAPFSMMPIVVDFHDETIWEVKEEHTEAALELFRECWSLTNEELGGIISLSGEPEACMSFANFKCEGPYRVPEIQSEFNLEVT